MVVLDAPLSFWGGMDAASGEVIDRRHPQSGASLAGAVVVMPSGRGSSSSSSVLAESVRAAAAPAAIVLARPDPIVALGVLVARELYGAAPPVTVVDADTYRSLGEARRARIEARPDGTVAIELRG